MSIPAEHLREGQTIFVRGKISYSRLAALIVGEELQRSIEAARKRGSLYPTDKPHTTISLVDAVVLPVNTAAPTLEEQYVAEKIYTVKSGDNAGKRGFSVDDKSPNLPPVFAPKGDGTHSQVVLEADLDSGLDVTLVLNTFKQGDYAKRGLGIGQVILNEELRYYAAAGGVDKNALAALGVIITGPIQRVSGSAAQPVPNQQDLSAIGGGAEIPAGSIMTDGLPMPAPVSDSPAPVVDPKDAEIARLRAQLEQPKPPMAQVPPAAPSDPKDAEIARLKAQLEANTASGGAQGASAFDAGQTPSPWGDGGQPGISLGS